MKLNNILSSNNGRLAKNTVMLFMLTFSNYLFGFITVPYQTRVLGPEIYGNIGFATSIMTYFQLFLDFGFLLSATEDVSLNRDNKREVCKIFTCVMYCKVILILIAFVVLTLVCLTVERFRSDALLFYIYLAAYSIYAFLPDFLYRGIENMQAITVRSVLIKFFCTCMIFIFLRDSSQYYVIPVLTGIGNLGAVIGVFFHLRSMGYGFAKVSLSDIFYNMKRSCFFFYSRIASAIFTATNTFILGMIYGSGATVVGLYSTSEKAITLAKQVINPVTESLYPYMVRNRNFKLIKKLLIIGMPVIFVGCAVVMFFAEPLCAFAFGAEYYDAGKYLRLLAPIVFFSYPTTMFGFPTLSPIGLSKQVNLSSIFAAAVQIVMLVILYITVGITAERICIATCITEAFTCCYRLTVVLINRNKFKIEDKQ